MLYVLYMKHMELEWKIYMIHPSFLSMQFQQVYLPVYATFPLLELMFNVQ